MWDLGHNFNLDNQFSSIFASPTYNCLDNFSPEYTACISTKVAIYLSAFNNVKHQHNSVPFDSDSKMLIVDCGASASFTYDETDFISYTKYKGKVQGLGEKQIIGKGTARYTITNDNGENVQLLVSNTYHIPDMPCRLLCPQQVAQQSRDPLAGGYATKQNFLLAWDYNCKTIQYDKHNNLPVLYTTPGGTNAAAFLAQNIDPFPTLYANKHALPFATPYHNNTSIDEELISARDEDNPSDYKSKQNIETTNQNHNDVGISNIQIETNHKSNAKKESSQFNQHKVEHNEDTGVTFENLSKSSKDLLTWHHKLNHMHMNTMQDLARHGSYHPT